MNETENFIEYLHKKYYSELIKKARRLTSDQSMAEDMVQSTMESALKNTDEVQNSPSVKGWLLKTLKFKMNRELDRAYRKHEVMIEDEYIPELVEGVQSEDNRLTLGGLDEILPVSCPTHMRKVLYLRYVEMPQKSRLNCKKPEKTFQAREATQGRKMSSAVKNPRIPRG